MALNLRARTEGEPNILADAVEGALELDEIRRGPRAAKGRGAGLADDDTEGGSCGKEIVRLLQALELGRTCIHYTLQQTTQSSLNRGLRGLRTWSPSTGPGKVNEKTLQGADIPTAQALGKACR